MDNDNPVKELIDEQLASDINEILETVEAGVESFTTHTKDLNNPHQVTKEQVGLGNADNTSDMDKPISNAVSSAIKSLEGKISGVDSAVETLENKVDSAVNTLNTKVDSAINTLETGIGLTVQGIMSAIHTHIQENEEQHRVIKSSVETLDNKVDSTVNTINGDIAQVKSSVETFKHEINSAIQTLEHEFDSDLETAKQEIIDVVDGFKVNLDFIATSVETLKSQTQSAIETNKTEVLNTVSGIKTSLQSAIETHKANTDSAVNTLNQNLNGVKSAVQTLDETNQQEHQDTLTLLDEKITEVKGLITTLDNKVISAVATLKALFAEADTVIKNEVTTAYQAKDTELQSAIDRKAANDHNHDSVYAKIGTAALSDGSVKSNHIANNAITAAHLAANSVGESELGYTPAKRTGILSVTELFTKAGVSGQITTAALVAGISKNIDNFRGITTVMWLRPAEISDLPADHLMVTIQAVGQNGIFMEARPPFGDNSLWIGSTNNGTWGGWKQIRTRSGYSDGLAFSVADRDGVHSYCVNTGLFVFKSDKNYCLSINDGSGFSTIEIPIGKNVTL